MRRYSRESELINCYNKHGSRPVSHYHAGRDEVSLRKLPVGKINGEFKEELKKDL